MLARWSLKPLSARAQGDAVVLCASKAALACSLPLAEVLVQAVLPLVWSLVFDLLRSASAIELSC